MLEAVQASSSPVEGNFYYPEDLPRGDGKKSYELGGAGLNDPNSGVNSRVWVAEIIGNTIQVYPEDLGESPVTLYSSTATTLAEVSLGFDLSVCPYLCFKEDGVQYLYWKNPLTSLYEKTEIVGATSGILILDRRFPFESSSADVAMFYLRNGFVEYRLQRDRFETPYVFSPIPIGMTRIDAAGLTTQGRLQLRFT